MWRSFFLAIGVYLCILGVEALAVERAIFKPEVVGRGKLIQSSEVAPPDWVPWSLMGAGSVTILYSIMLPKRVGGG